MFEERRGQVYVTPSIGFLHNLRYEAEAFGFGKAVIEAMGVPQHMEANVRTHVEAAQARCANTDRRGLRAELAAAWHQCARYRAFCQLSGVFAGRGAALRDPLRL